MMPGRLELAPRGVQGVFREKRVFDSEGRVFFLQALPQEGLKKNSLHLADWGLLQNSPIL